MTGPRTPDERASQPAGAGPTTETTNLKPLRFQGIAAAFRGLRLHGRKFAAAVGQALVYLIGGLAMAGLLFWGVGVLAVTLLVAAVVGAIFALIPWSKLDDALLWLLLSTWAFLLLRAVVIVLVMPLVRWVQPPAPERRRH